VDIVVKGRNVEVPDHYREHVADKLSKVERYDQKLMRADVELFHERNPRQSDRCQRVEITVMTRGPVVRAEACAQDFYAALDCAINKLDGRLRRSADRRRVHRGRRAPVSVAAATAGLPTDLPSVAPEPDEDAFSLAEHDDNQPWRIVREKEHPADPMTVDDALFQMELVGHDFYLFHDKESGRPSVVYRRRGYDYGLLSLESTA
jgi:ribosomal subunit interface protein